MTEAQAQKRRDGMRARVLKKKYKKKEKKKENQIIFGV